MIFRPFSFLIGVSALSSIAAAIPHLQNRQIKYPFQCQAQCDRTDTEILACGGDKGCLCNDLLLGQSNICFSCIATDKPELTEDLQVLLNQVTASCEASGFSVKPQVLSTNSTTNPSGTGGSDDNPFSGIPNPSPKTELKCKLPCDQFQTQVSVCQTEGEGDAASCICSQDSTVKLATCFNCVAMQEKNSTITSALQDGMDKLAQQCTAANLPITPITISEDPAANPPTSGNGAALNFDTLPDTTARSEIKCRLRCAQLVDLVTCTTATCQCTQRNADLLGACFNCVSTTEKNATVTTGLQGSIAGFIDNCDKVNATITIAALSGSDGSPSNSSTSTSTSASSSATSSSVSQSSVGSATTSTSSTETPAASSLSGNAGNSAISLRGTFCTSILGVWVGMLVMFT
ncbi:hypothetical protein VNI00_007241 [Paramarasmius palmivorus]|uniref:Uncharacterized protein n=1 Tax=Paramarasmius palmivorus TaxID=297713 RepID=A0AAW0D2G7_9AGAR